MDGAKTAPVDGARSRRLSGSVYSLRLFPLPAERHPQHQRDHLQRPAQIAEIMHFPPRPDLRERPADPGELAYSNACCAGRAHTVFTGSGVQPGKVARMCTL